MTLAYRQDRPAAKTIAEKVLTHCQQAQKTMWCLATQGEANLLVGNVPLALENYRLAVISKPTPRQVESMYHQAMKIADLIRDPEAGAGLETVFRPNA